MTFVALAFMTLALVPWALVYAHLGGLSLHNIDHTVDILYFRPFVAFIGLYNLVMPQFININQSPPYKCVCL